MKITTKMNLFSPVWVQKKHNELNKLKDFKEFKKGGFYTDESQICGISFKSPELEQLFWETFNVRPVDTIPKINFKARTQYPVDYLINLLNTMKSSSHVTISMGIDTPIKLENKEMEIYLAPRINPDDEKTQLEFLAECKKSFLLEFTQYELEIEVKRRMEEAQNNAKLRKKESKKVLKIKKGGLIK